MEKLIDIGSAPVAPLLDILLADKSTKKNIIWATDTYEEYGHGFTDKEHRPEPAPAARGHHQAAYPEITGSTGGANKKKGGGFHSGVALQSDEQLLRPGVVRQERRF